MESNDSVHLTPEKVRAFWAAREPRLLAFFDAMDNREHWPLRNIDEALSSLYLEAARLLGKVEQEEGDTPLLSDGISKLLEAAAALPCSASTVFFEWLSKQHAQLPYFILERAHRHRLSDPNASVLWQRAEMIARHQILKEIVADITHGGDPL